MTEHTPQLRWRMPEEGEPLYFDRECTRALARAFGHYPITLRPEREKELRAMGAVLGDPGGNPFELLANLISNRGTIVLFLDHGENAAPTPGPASIIR